LAVGAHAGEWKIDPEMLPVEVSESVPDPMAVAFASGDSLELFGYLQRSGFDRFTRRAAMLLALHTGSNPVRVANTCYPLMMSILLLQAQFGFWFDGNKLW